MIANMDQGRRGLQPAPQLYRKQDEFVDVRQPLRDVSACKSKAPQKGLRLNQLRRNACGGQAIQHHRGKALHALQAIGRVVTDQQNHCFDHVEHQDHACDRHRRSGARRPVRSRLCPLRAEQPRSRFLRHHFAPPKRDLW